MDRSELGRAIWSASHLNGHFTLRSGQTASEYFDKYQFESDPTLLSLIASALASLIPERVEVLAGLELGGVPVATALSLNTGLPCAFVRKAAKSYGTAKLAEGPPIEGRRVLLVEDVVTSGGQILESADELRRLEAKVDAALCVIDRGQGGAEALAAGGIRLIPLFTATELADFG